MTVTKDSLRHLSAASSLRTPGFAPRQVTTPLPEVAAAAAVFGSPDRYAGRTVEIAGDALTGKALAEHLTQAAGRPITYSRLPTTLLAQDGRLVGNANLDALRAEFPFLLRFDRWLAGPGAGLLEEALRSAGTGIALR